MQRYSDEDENKEMGNHMPLCIYSVNYANRKGLRRRGHIFICDTINCSQYRRLHAVARAREWIVVDTVLEVAFNSMRSVPIGAHSLEYYDFIEISSLCAFEATIPAFVLELISDIKWITSPFSLLPLKTFLDSKMFEIICYLSREYSIIAFYQYMDSRRYKSFH